MTAEELLSHASEFTFLPAGAQADDDDVSRFAVKVSWRGHDRWAVTRFGDCWGPEGWEHEASPSNRTPEFLAVHRYGLEDAIALARQLVDGVVVNGRSWARWQERFLIVDAVGQ